MRLIDSELKTPYLRGEMKYQMGTRANVIIKDDQTTLYFYRHSDGYPKHTGESLSDFVLGYKFENMRNNALQSAGWLILKGHFEYLNGGEATSMAQPRMGNSFKDEWKVGAYEPTSALHGDVEYIYVIDLEKMTLSCRAPGNGYWEKPSLKNTIACKEFKTVNFGLKVVA